MIIRYLLLTFLIIMVYRFVVFVVLPFLNITRTANNSIKAMRKDMDDMKTQRRNASNKKVEGEFIDYEEIK